MTTDFQIKPLAYQAFADFFTMNTSELAQAGALKMTVDKKPGFPCRVSLEDAEVGEEVILLPFRHHPTSSPYQASGPIYVRKNATSNTLGVNEIPEMLTQRLLSVRAYDKNGMMQSAVVAEGRDLHENIQKLFSNEAVHYLHLHNAKPGCYNCLVVRKER